MTFDEWWTGSGMTRGETIFRNCWDAALEAAAARAEKDDFQYPGPRNRSHVMIGTATEAVAAEIRNLKTKP